MGIADVYDQCEPGFNREFKIYDAAGSTTRLRKKEICHARQKL
jgi:hypothetical protein